MITCALVIGHTEKRPGARCDVLKANEYHWNEPIAREVKEITDRNGEVDVQLVYRTRYSTLPHEINDLAPDFIVSLHFNSASKSATGTETLYWKSSSQAKSLAQIFQDAMLDTLGLRDRGVKGLTSPKDRGAPLLRRTNAPCIILEPFFGSNNKDGRIAKSNRDNLVAAYATAIEDAAEELFFN